MTFGKESKPVCSTCQSKPQQCDLCYRKCKPSLMRDGRRICPSCSKTRILTQEQAEEVYDKVKRYLKAHPAKLLVKDPPPVQIADKDEIQTKFVESGRAMNVAGSYQPYNPEQILILSGLTPSDCAATQIHEYTHAWQSRNCPSQDRALTEGFASWVEYHYLVSIGRQREATNLTRKSDPDYGASLIKLLEMEQKMGPTGIVKFAKTATALP